MNHRMALILTTATLTSLHPLCAAAGEKYCPQKSQYIHTGMTMEQVLAACGEPFNRAPLTNGVSEKVPMTQLIYSSTVPANPYPGYKAAFYRQWSIPMGPNVSSNTELEVDIVDHKVHEIRVGNSTVKRSNFCQGTNIQAPGIPFQVGDSEEQVYASCGSPDTINHTYMEKSLSGKNPEDWTYQVDPYQPAFHLIFMNGILKAIQ